MATLKNTNDLITQAATDLPDNSTQRISPRDVREAIENVAFSSFNKVTDSPLVGLKAYNTLVTYESGQGCVNGGKIYISSQSTGPGAFNAAHWDLYDNLTTAQKAKLDFISVTQAVDLDAIEDAINNVTNPYLNKGLWDASVGVFPGSGSAKNGWTYICSVSGTVDGRDFVANQDKITALINNASTGTYTNNWFKTDGSDLVTSVNGSTGAVSVTPNATHTGEVTGATALTLDKTSISNRTLVTLDPLDHVLIGDASDADNLKKVLASDFGSAGKVAIYDANGKPTFFDTLQLSLNYAGANSISVVHLQTDLKVVNCSLVNGVSINLNGFTIFNDNDDATSTIETNISTGYIGKIYNGRILRNGRALNAAGRTFVVKNQITEIDFEGVLVENTFGDGFLSELPDSTYKIKGLRVIAYGDAIKSSTGISGCEGRSLSGGAGVQLSAGAKAIDSRGYSVSGIGLQAADGVNCYGETVSGLGGVGTGTYSNTTARGGSGAAFYTTGVLINCNGISQSEYAAIGVSQCNNSYLRSVNFIVVSGDSVMNSTLITDTGSVVCNMSNNAIVDGCLIISNTNSGTARGVQGGTNNYVTRNTIKMNNTAAAAIYYFSTTAYYANNVFIGTTNPVQVTTQGIINASDSQGNILA